MRFIKIVGLAVLASLAVGMVASATASAELGIFQCEKKTGATLSSNCLTFGGGEFTVKPITGTNFTGKALSPTTTLASGANSITCTGALTTGKATSLTESVLTIKFTGCKNQGGSNCETAGAPNSTTIESPLSGKIVSVGSGSSLTAGLLLAPRNAAGANLLTINCNGTAVKVYGSVIGAIGPEDAMELSLVTTFKVNSGVQAIEESTNSLRASFGGGATNKATEEGVGLIDFALKVEVMGLGFCSCSVSLGSFGCGAWAQCGLTHRLL